MSDIKNSISKGKAIGFPEDYVPRIKYVLDNIDKTLSNGLDVYPEIFNTGWFPLQRMRETKRMMQIVRGDNGIGHKGPQTVMEIGSAGGCGVYHWCKCMYPSIKRMIAVDIVGCPYSHLFEKAFPSIDFLWVEESSYENSTVKCVEKWLKSDKIDVLFIDGDKNNFLTDFDAYLPLMNSNGIVIMHDQKHNPTCEWAFQEVVRRKKYKTEVVIDISESEEAMRREREGIAPVNGYEAWIRQWKGRSCGFGVVYLGIKYQE